MNQKKAINISIVNPLLKLGVIKISHFKGTLLRATFFPQNAVPVSVSSDRGIKHLFVSLYAIVIAKNEEERKKITQEVNKCYQYPLFFNHTSKLISIMGSSFTELSYEEKELHEDKKFNVRMEQTEIPNLNIVAGKYVKKGQGSSLEKAFGAALLAEPMLL